MSWRWLLVPGLVLGVLRGPGVARAFDVVLNAQGEYLDAYLVNGQPFPPRVVLIDPDPPAPDDPRSLPPRVGRHVNGKLCFFPRGFGHDGQFVIADDTYREACRDREPPQARCTVRRRRSPFYVGKDPDGWGVFRRDGTWTRQHIHTAWDFSEPEPQGNIDPQGCAFDARGNLWGNDVGHGAASTADGSLVVFFPGKRRRYDTYCFLDKGLRAPGMPVLDAIGDLYLAETAGARVLRFSPPFPRSARECANPERLVTTPPTKSVFLTLAASGEATPAGIVYLPADPAPSFIVGSVLIPPVIRQYGADGGLVRTLVPEGVPRNPLGLDVGSDGTLYYAELNLDPATFAPRCGGVAAVRLTGADPPGAPMPLGKDLRFPDGVTVVDSTRFRVDFTKLPAAPALDPSRCGGE
jgi:hypothetical protein